jgi:hypothetical protein
MTKREHINLLEKELEDVPDDATVVFWNSDLDIPFEMGVESVQEHEGGTYEVGMY